MPNVLPAIYTVPFEGAGAVAEVLRTTKYLFAAGEAAVKLPDKLILVTLEKDSALGCAVGVAHGKRVGTNSPELNMIVFPK